ncbi:MAG TPA: sensor histidine kinase [Caulobacteraceae bacterium]
MKAPSVRLLLILLTLSIIVPAVGLTAYLLWADYERQEDQFEDQLLSTTRAVSIALDGRIGQGEGVLNGLAASGPRDTDLSAFYDRAKAATRNLPGWISLTDPSGHDVLNTRVPFGQPLGAQVSPEVVSRLYGQPMLVSDVYTGPVSRQPVFSITQPAVIGGKSYYLSYVTSPHSLDSVLKEQHLPKGWVVAVVDRKGHILARWPSVRDVVGHAATPSFLDASRREAEGTVHTHSLEGVANTAAFSRSAITGWTSAIGVPRTLLLAQAVQSMATLAVAAALLLAAGLGVAVVLSRRLSRAFILAVRRADDIGRGEHPRPARPVVAEDETLFLAMEQAAQRLDERNLQNERAREHQRLLLNELNHRVKNTLSTVQSIALQTARQTGAPQEFVTAFEGRLLSLSKTHSALMNEDWEGADLYQVLENELFHFGPDRFVLEGPLVMLPPRAALALGLVIHELATNASKYGALSSTTGQIHVVWSLVPGAEPPELDLIWRERGGPKVQPPTRVGFGSRLIERTLAGELAGRATFNFAEGGLVLTAHATLRSGGFKSVAELS